MYVFTDVIQMILVIFKYKETVGKTIDMKGEIHNVK